MEVNNKLQNKAYIGIITDITGSHISLQIEEGSKSAIFNQDTVYLGQKGKKKYSQSGILKDDNIAALGDVDEVQVLTAKKIILLSNTIKLKTVLWGQIISISDQIVTIKDKDLKNHAVIVTSKTKLQKGEDFITLSDIKNNNIVIITGNLNEHDILEAKFIYVTPQGVISKPKKTATPSAEISTKSATSKPATSSGKKK